MSPLTRARAAAEAPTLLDTLARAPAAAALVVRALERAKDRKALRLAHSQLRDAVGEATTKLEAHFDVDAAPARPPTPLRWPRLEVLASFASPNLATLEALGSGTWACLRSLRFKNRNHAGAAFEAPSARALAAALRRMPALRKLSLRHMTLSDASAAELLRASSAEAAPQPRSLVIQYANLSPAAARLLAATGWRLEELDLFYNPKLGAAGLAALLAAPTFALRRADLRPPPPRPGLLRPRRGRPPHRGKRPLAACGAWTLRQRLQRRCGRPRARGALAARGPAQVERELLQAERGRL